MVRIHRMGDGQKDRTTITLLTSTRERLRKYQARLIGEREDPNLSMDDTVDALLSEVEGNHPPAPIHPRRPGGG
jgi:hypothetical protein